MKKIKYLLGAFPTFLSLIAVQIKLSGGAKLISPFSVIIVKFHVKSLGSNNRLDFGKRCRLLRTKVSFSGKNNICKFDGVAVGTIIEVQGEGNEVVLCENSGIKNSRIVVRGNNLNVTIGKNATIVTYCSIFPNGNVGKNATIGNNCWLVTMGNKHCINIGEECMIADNVDLWASDTHPIRDKKIWKSQTFQAVLK